MNALPLWLPVCNMDVGLNMRLRCISGKVGRALGVGLVFCAAAAAETTTIYTFTTAANATSQGNPVAAQAVIELTSNHIHVVLTNLLNNPLSVGQALSFLFFKVDNGTTAGTLTSSSAMSRDVKGNGTYKDLGTIATGWKLLGSGNLMELCDIGCGAAGPANTLIGGPGANNKYSTNSSIAGNGPHNPFLVGNAVFDLAVTGVTYQSKIQNVTYGFGTTAGYNVNAGGYTVATVPEPSAILLLASCIVAVGLISRRKRVTDVIAR